MTVYQIAKLVEKGVRAAPTVSIIDCQIFDAILKTPEHLARTARIVAALGVSIPELLDEIARLAEIGDAALNAEPKQPNQLH